MAQLTFVSALKSSTMPGWQDDSNSVMMLSLDPGRGCNESTMQLVLNGGLGDIGLPLELRLCFEPCVQCAGQFIGRMLAAAAATLPSLQSILNRSLAILRYAGEGLGESGAEFPFDSSRNPAGFATGTFTPGPAADVLLPAVSALPQDLMPGV